MSKTKDLYLRQQAELEQENIEHMEYLEDQRYKHGLLDECAYDACGREYYVNDHDTEQEFAAKVDSYVFSNTDQL